MRADAYVAGNPFHPSNGHYASSHVTWLFKCKHDLICICMTACDVPGIKRLLPAEWRDLEFFNNIYELIGVPVVTVQLRYNGWVTEMRDIQQSR